jgi:hypothetical protein
MLERLDALHSSLSFSDVVVAKAMKLSEVAQMGRIETLLRDLYEKKWNALADRATQRAVARYKETARSLPNARLKHTLNVVDVEMRRWAPSLEDATRRDVRRVYALASAAGWKKATKQTKAPLIVEVAKADFKVKPSFDLVDEEAVNALARHQLYWIGKFYDDAVSGAVASTVRERMFQFGGDREAAGEELGRTLRTALGVFEIPGGYVGSTKSYFEGVVANAFTVTRAAAQIRSFEEAGVVTYTISNPFDERTCPTCIHMDGKSFSVEFASKMIERLIDAKSPEDVRNIQPWVSYKQLTEISPFPGPRGPADAGALAERSLCLPPFHFRCRCAIDVSEESWTRPVVE